MTGAQPGREGERGAKKRHHNGSLAARAALVQGSGIECQKYTREGETADAKEKRWQAGEGEEGRSSCSSARQPEAQLVTIGHVHPASFSRRASHGFSASTTLRAALCSWMSSAFSHVPSRSRVSSLRAAHMFSSRSWPKVCLSPIDRELCPYA